MICSQRGSSFTNVGEIYSLDRFKLDKSNTGAAFTITQSTTSPNGFAKSLKMDCTTADTSTAANEFVALRHKIEAQDLQDLAYGTSAAKALVLSFYVRSNVTGTYSVTCLQRDNSSKLYARTYTINSADTWERKTISIPADTSGVINDDNGSGFEIYFSLIMGSNYKTGSVSSAWETYGTRTPVSATTWWTTNDATIEITGVQLEVGSVATDFEHRSVGDELARCQRYYFNIEGNNDDMAGCSGYAVWHDVHWFQVIFPVPMRTIPSYTGSATAGRFYAHNSGNTFNFNQLALKTNSNDTTHKSCQLINNGVSGGSEDGLGGELNFQADNGKLEFSAEL